MIGSDGGGARHRLICLAHLPRPGVEEAKIDPRLYERRVRLEDRPVAAQRLAAGLVAMAGRGISWLLLVLVVITFSVVVLRYGMNLGWIWLQELIVYLHAAVFLIAIAWTFQADEHVRVDIF